ncbi:MAG: hypothetical protein ABSB26_06335 [Nitrososphaerales archaeon]
MTDKPHWAPPQKGYQKFAWVLFLPCDVFYAVFGVLIMFHPIEEFFFALGTFLLVSALSMLIVVLGSFRRGKKWAWYASWYHVYLLVPLFGLGAPYYWFSAFAVLAFLSLLGLLLPYREFIPKNTQTQIQDYAP